MGPHKSGAWVLIQYWLASPTDAAAYLGARSKDGYRNLIAELPGNSNVVVIVNFLAFAKCPSGPSKCLARACAPDVHIYSEMHSVVIGAGVLFIKFRDGAKTFDKVTTALLVFQLMLQFMLRCGNGRTGAGPPNLFRNACVSRVARCDAQMAHRQAGTNLRSAIILSSSARGSSDDEPESIGRERFRG